MKTKIRLVALAVSLGIVVNAQAHSIWIELTSKQSIAIRFGEFAENLREISPGLLDSFGNLTATLISPEGERQLVVTKDANGFTLPAKPGKGESIVVEDQAFPLRKSERNGKEVAVWYRPAARYIVGDSAQTPRLDLDISPTGHAGQFTVTFKGRPLAATDVQVLTQSGWTKQVRTDEQGRASFDMPWKGQYVIEASHTDSTPGERQKSGDTEKYDSVYYATTLGFVKAKGVPVPSAGSSATPAR